LISRSRLVRAAGIVAFVFAFVGVAGEALFSQAPAPQIAGRGGGDTGAPAFPVVLKGRLERVKVSGKALEGNLLEESAAPDVSIYLPPSYQTDRARRYPVVYLLHGYGSTDLTFFGPSGWELEIKAERVFESGAAREMIMAMPNCMNAFGGCMDSSSVTTGDWETYIADDLVAYIDKNYRTIPRRDARGLGGQSMGGYGTIRIGMKRPDVFAAIYAMSSCCLNEGTVSAGISGQPSAAELVTSIDEVRGRIGPTPRALAKAAAWSPNPQNPPLYLDLPTKNGAVVSDVAVKWAANSPVAMLDQYMPNLREYKAIALDIGRQDPLIMDNRMFVQRLIRYNVLHTFETYDGDHNNRVGQRLEEHVLPFFSKHLSFEQGRETRR
jgi:S-formylglutathione hydrolase FrmB